MIIDWCVIALSALIIGGVTAIIRKDSDCFAAAVALNILIGFGYLITIVNQGEEKMNVPKLAKNLSDLNCHLFEMGDTEGLKIYGSLLSNLNIAFSELRGNKDK